MRKIRSQHGALPDSTEEGGDLVIDKLLEVLRARAVVVCPLAKCPRRFGDVAHERHLHPFCWQTHIASGDPRWKALGTALGAPSLGLLDLVAQCLASEARDADLAEHPTTICRFFVADSPLRGFGRDGLSDVDREVKVGDRLSVALGLGLPMSIAVRSAHQTRAVLDMGTLAVQCIYRIGERHGKQEAV